MVSVLTLLPSCLGSEPTVSGGFTISFCKSFLDNSNGCFVIGKDSFFGLGATRGGLSCSPLLSVPGFGLFVFSADDILTGDDLAVTPDVLSVIPV